MRAKRDNAGRSRTWPPCWPKSSGSNAGNHKGMLPPDRAWQRLRHMQDVVAHQPAIAYAVHCLPLYDKLELTLELLNQDGWPEFDTPEPLPPNVVRFRPRGQAPSLSLAPLGQ